jgi:CheY-like chemotaxis protein
MPLKAVLVVEDETLVRFGTVALVEDAGYLALEAADADDAVRTLEARPDIHVVVTDVNMPAQWTVSSWHTT